MLALLVKNPIYSELAPHRIYDPFVMLNDGSESETPFLILPITIPDACVLYVNVPFFEMYLNPVMPPLPALSKALSLAKILPAVVPPPHQW